jgi:hypothetical protein
VKKYVYGNTRIALHLRHVLRPLGQRDFEPDLINGVSAVKKARLYYSGSKEYRKYLEQDLIDAGPIDRTPMAKVDMNIFLPKTVLKRGRDWDEEKDVVWYHTDERFAPHKFLDCVRFPFPDRRTRRRYRRRLNREYLSNGHIARARRADEEVLYARGKRRPKTPVDFSSNSIHEICPVIEQTDSFKIQNLGPDPMHMFANANNNFIRVFKGERGLQDGSRELSYSQGKHASLQYTQCNADWECVKDDQDFVDAVVNGFFIPAHYSNDYRIRNPMKQRGFMKSKDHFGYLIAYASFVMSFTDIAPDYVTFLAMYADDMCDLFNPRLSASKLSLLKKKILETRSVQEGLFPESEQIFIFHEIVDIVNHILKFGHLRGLMCFSGERANGEIAACITRGGVNYMLTLISRYILKENCSLKHFLFRNEYDYDNSGMYSDFVLKLHGKSEIIHHFGNSDYNNLYKVVFNFLQTQGISELIMLQSSPFYRLYTAYLFMCDNNTNEFFTWLVNFDSALHNRSCDDDTATIGEYCVDLSLDLIDSLSDEVLHCAHGVVFLSDLSSVSECLIPQKKFQAYSNVIVKGIKFKCRGTHFSVSVGPHNDLIKCYEWKKHYSCIARVKSYRLEERDANNVVVLPSRTRRRFRNNPMPQGHKLVTSHTIQFAWLNCAFRLNIHCDPMIHGLAIAHCALRDGIYSDKRWQHCVDVRGALCSDRFVCLNYVDSSPIVSSAFNSDGKVLLRTGDMSAFTATSLPNPHCYAASFNNILAHLYLIPIKPERLSVTYDTVLRDADHTLVLEADCCFKHA